MRLPLKSSFVVALVAGITLALAPAAPANSFSTTISDVGSYSYDDGADRFCVKAYNGSQFRYIQAELKPVNGVGPSRFFSDDSTDSGSNCVGLATAYEDARYKAVVAASLFTNRTAYFYSADQRSQVGRGGPVPRGPPSRSADSELRFCSVPPRFGGRNGSSFGDLETSCGFRSSGVGIRLQCY